VPRSSPEGEIAPFDRVERNGKAVRGKRERRADARSTSGSGQGSGRPSQSRKIIKECREACGAEWESNKNEIDITKKPRSSRGVITPASSPLREWNEDVKKDSDI